MRQYELAIRIAQVHHLVDERKYKKALAVIQTLDMRQVRSLSDLKVFAEVYTRTEQFDAAKVTYLRIYRRSQTRRVLHRLIYLSIRTNALDEAEMYYQEFVRTNPNERDALIMRYRIDKARGVPIGRLIEILQDLKQEEYIEEWAYELAKLYHRAGRREECIAECEDILLWFGTGEIVERAKILIDHLEERDPIPYYDDKDFTEPKREEPNPEDTGSLPDLSEYIKKRKAQRKGERLAEHTARREEKFSVRQEEKKAAVEKAEPKPLHGEDNLPETDEEVEKEIDRQLESYDEEDEMDRELSVRVAEKAQAERNEEKRAVKTDMASEEFIDDYQEDESFGENMDLSKKAIDGIQKLLKFGKKEEDRDKEKEPEKEEPEREKLEKEKEEEKPKSMAPSANAAGEREYVPHSQSGTGITQDLAREISAIYEMEHKEQLQEKAVTVINDSPPNIATNLVERMNQALQQTQKKYIPLDVEEISARESGVLEGDTKDLSSNTDAWVDEAVTKDLSRHSARLNRQAKKELRHKQQFRREALEKNSAEDARERLKNIVENRREQRGDIAEEESRFKREEHPADMAADIVDEKPENMEEVSEDHPVDAVADGMDKKSENVAGGAEEFSVDAAADVMEESSEDETELLRQLLEGEVQEPAELSELSGEADLPDEQETLDGLLENTAEASILVSNNQMEEPEAASEPQNSIEEPESGAVFHSVEPQASETDDEAQLDTEIKAEVEERLEQDPEEGYSDNTAEEWAEEPEPEKEQQEPIEEAEDFDRADLHSVEPQALDRDMEARLKEEVEEQLKEECEKEVSDDGEEEWAEEPEPEIGEPELKPEPEIEGPEPKPEIEEPKLEPKPEPEIEEPKLEPKPEPEIEEPKPEPEIEQQEPEPERVRRPRLRRQAPPQMSEPVQEQEPAEGSVNRLSREMAAYHAPKIPVVETEYMEMPEITYDDLPTTRALQESFDYVLQLIEGELEPSHFVLMGDGTERIVGVAKRIVRVMKNAGYISRGRIAKIHAKQLNKMDLISFRSQLFGNCLLIDGAADLLFPTITRMFSIMEEYRGNFVVILADEGTTLDQLFRFVPALAKRFQYIIDISKYTSEDYE